MLFYIAVCGQAKAKKILLVPAQVPSHIFEMTAAVSGLVKNGHEVYITIGSAFNKKDKVTKSGVTPLIFKSDPNGKTLDEITDKIFEEPGHALGNKLSLQVLNDCESMVYDRDFMKTLKELKFDLAIGGGFPLCYCSFIIPKVLGVPYVFLFSAVHPWSAGIPALPSFVPMIIPFPARSVSDNMTFLDRVQTLMWYAIMLVGEHTFAGNRDTTLLQKFAPEMSSWNEVVQKSELFIITRNHLLEWPAPTLPNVIITPGITVNPAKPLPEELEKIAKNGFILVSFGSIANNFPKEYTEKLVQAFNQLDDTIIWKFTGKSRAEVKLNDNVHLLDWMPQNDLLGHPQIRVFVTHCGNNGQYEALYHGVPMVGLPYTGDQFHNSFRQADHGFGVNIPGGIADFTVEELVGAIQEVASNSAYKENIAKASKILKDSPMSPSETVTYWLEHIMSFGSKHLRSQSLDMPLYQLFMVDVLGFVFLVMVVLLYVTKLLLSRILNVLLFRKAKTE